MLSLLTAIVLLFLRISLAQDFGQVSSYVTISDDGAYVAYISNGTLQVADTETLQPLFDYPELAGNVITVDWNPDNRTLAIATTMDSIYLWSVEQNPRAEPFIVLEQPVVSTFDPYADYLTSLDWHPNGRYLASIAISGEFQTFVWDTSAQIPVLKLQTGDSSNISWNRDGSVMAVTNASGISLIDFITLVESGRLEWEFSEWQIVSRLVMKSPPGLVNEQPLGYFTWSADERQIVASTWVSGEIWLIDAESGEGRVVSQINQPKQLLDSFRITDLKYDSVHQKIYAALTREYAEVPFHSQIVMWDIETGEEAILAETATRIEGFDYNTATGQITYDVRFATDARDGETEPGLDGFRAPN